MNMIQLIGGIVFAGLAAGLAWVQQRFHRLTVGLKKAIDVLPDEAWLDRLAQHLGSDWVTVKDDLDALHLRVVIVLTAATVALMIAAALLL